MNRINATAPAERNKRPIFEHLTSLLRDARRVLEVGAGDGTHACHALICLPGVHWQATEHQARVELLRRGLAGCRDMPRPLALDVTGEAWPTGPFDAVYAANVSHIMHWPEVTALMAGAAAVLAPNGWLCLYGPFLDDTVVTAPGNREFDRRLRGNDPGMGLRRVQALDALAIDNGLHPRYDWAMPANNRLRVWRKTADANGGR